MKPLLVINPNTSVGVTAAIRHGVKAFSGGVDVEVANVAWGPLSVESELDSLIAANAVVETVWSRRDDYSGFVVACFDDPGLVQVREVVEAPVVGIGEAAITEARDLYQKIGVIVVSRRVSGRVAEHFGRYGVQHGRLRFASLDGCVVDLNSPTAEVAERFKVAAGRLRDQGAQCIALACAGFSQSAEPIRQAVGLPVLDGNHLAVERAWRYLSDGGYQTQLEAPRQFRGQRPAVPPWSDRASSHAEGASS